MTENKEEIYEAILSGLLARSIEYKLSRAETESRIAANESTAKHSAAAIAHLEFLESERGQQEEHEAERRKLIVREVEAFENIAKHLDRIAMCQS